MIQGPAPKVLHDIHNWYHWAYFEGSGAEFSEGFWLPGDLRHDFCSPFFRVESPHENCPFSTIPEQKSKHLEVCQKWKS